MILINGNWEQVNNLQDVIRVVGEYYNDELARIIESVLPEYSEEEFWELEDEIGDKINEIESLEDEIASLESDIERLEDDLEGAEKEIDELEAKIAELENR